jgi:hypothetical protein
MVARISTGFAIVLLGVGVLWQGAQLNSRIARLERACIPADTGGGVTQCLQPNVRQTQEDDPGWNCHTMGNRICGQRKGTQ